MLSCDVHMALLISEEGNGSPPPRAHFRSQAEKQKSPKRTLSTQQSKGRLLSDISTKSKGQCYHLPSKWRCLCFKPIPHPWWEGRIVSSFRGATSPIPLLQKKTDEWLRLKPHGQDEIEKLNKNFWLLGLDLLMKGKGIGWSARTLRKEIRSLNDGNRLLHCHCRMSLSPKLMWNMFLPRDFPHIPHTGTQQPEGAQNSLSMAHSKFISHRYDYRQSNFFSVA